MQDIIIQITQAIFYYFLGSLIINLFIHFFLKNRMTENVAQADKEIVDNIFKKIHPVSIEKHGDIYYWFDSESDHFLAQGKNLAEAVDHLKERFPTDIFFAKLEGQVYQIGAPDWVPRKRLT